MLLSFSGRIRKTILIDEMSNGEKYGDRRGQIHLDGRRRNDMKFSSRIITNPDSG